MDKEQALLSSGLFEIGSDGSIWRVAKRQGRGVKVGGGYHKGAKVAPCPRVRAEYATRSGYLLVAATINKTKIVTGAHRLVWVHRNEPISDGLTINHKNGVKTDNRPENLELATYSEQRYHAIRVLGAKHHDVRGAKHPKTHLTEADVLKIRELRANGVMVKKISRQYEMNPRAISAICNRRTWKHI